MSGWEKKPLQLLWTTVKNRTSASLREHSVCCWWAAGVYGYSERFILVAIVALLLALSWHSAEGRCPEDKDSKGDHTMELLTFICINKSVFFVNVFAYFARRLCSANWGEIDCMCQQLMKSCCTYQIVCCFRRQTFFPFGHI